jgi:hypothetical protein
VLPGGSTSYYTTSSVYTTHVPQYKTVTVTDKVDCGKGGCHGPGATTTPTYTQVAQSTAAYTNTLLPPPPPQYSPTFAPQNTYIPTSTCPSATPYTVTVYAPVTFTATMTVTVHPKSESPLPTPPTPTAPAPMVCHRRICRETVCVDGKCEVVTTYPTTTYGNWNGTGVNSAYYPTGTGSGSVGTGTAIKY